MSRYPPIYQHFSDIFTFLFVHITCCCQHIWFFFSLHKRWVYALRFLLHLFRFGCLSSLLFFTFPFPTFDPLFTHHSYKNLLHFSCFPYPSYQSFIINVFSAIKFLLLVCVPSYSLVSNSLQCLPPRNLCLQLPFFPDVLPLHNSFLLPIHSLCLTHLLPDHLVVSLAAHGYHPLTLRSSDVLLQQAVPLSREGVPPLCWRSLS